MKIKDCKPGERAQFTDSYGHQVISTVIDHGKNIGTGYQTKKVLVGWKAGEAASYDSSAPNNFSVEETRDILLKNNFIKGQWVGEDCEVTLIFVAISTKPISVQKDITDWKSWRSQNENECPCGISQQQCTYHKT